MCVTVPVTDWQPVNFVHRASHPMTSGGRGLEKDPMLCPTYVNIHHINYIHILFVRFDQIFV